MTVTTEDRTDPVQPNPLPSEPPAGFWMADPTHFPVPSSPAMRSLFPTLSATSKGLAADLGMLIDGAEYRSIGGWTYFRLIPLGDKRGPKPPSWILPVLVRAVPALRRRVGAAERALREDLPGRLIDEWHDQSRQEFANRLGSIPLDLSALSDPEIASHVNTCTALFADGSRAHFRLHGALMIILAELAFFCHDHLGWDDAAVLDLLAGTSPTSTRPARELAKITTVAKGSADVQALLDAAAPADQVLAADPEFTAAFQAYQHGYGSRAMRYDIAEATLAEDPELLLQLIRDHLTTRYDPDRPDPAVQRADHAAATARHRLPDAQRSRFDRLLARARRAYPVREDNEFYTVSAPYAQLRYALLEVGRRLTDRNIIVQPDHVFQLDITDAMAALLDGKNRSHLVRSRQAETEWALADPGPPSYGSVPDGPPPFDALPPAARLVNKAFAWSFALLNPVSNTDNATTTTVTGIGAAPGNYLGPVRVIRDETEFAKIQAGDVLVCSITSPVWSVLFPSIGALVTDSGGLLSHPAIIAREFGIPAVIGTGNATDMLHDGQLVTVDGINGTVRVEP